MAMLAMMLLHTMHATDRAVDHPKSYAQEFKLTTYAQPRFRLGAPVSIAGRKACEATVRVHKGTQGLVHHGREQGLVREEQDEEQGHQGSWRQQGH